MYTHRSSSILYIIAVMACILLFAFFCLRPGIAGADPQDDYWELIIKAKGQEIDGIPSGDMVYIGIAASDSQISHPGLPPGITVHMFIISGEQDLIKDHRESGNLLGEVWDVTIEIGGDADADDPNFFPVLSWDPNAIGPASKI